MYTVEGNLPGDSNAYEIRAACISFFILTPLFVATRLWSRIQSRSRLGWDDYTILTSWALAQVLSGLLLASCAYGFGQHIQNLSLGNKVTALKLFHVAIIFYKLATNLTKASILLFYLRSFCQKWFRATNYTLLAIILGYMVAGTASSIWQCSPVARAWDDTINGSCIDTTANWYANAGFSIATNAIVVVLPIYPIYASNLRLNQKLALACVLTLGAFVTITSILRMQSRDPSSSSPDQTYNVTPTTWTVIEENMAIICACLPVCKAPLYWIFPSLLTPLSRENSKTPTNARAAGSYRGGHWTPIRGDKEKLSVRMTSVNGRLTCVDNNSEEYILEPVAPAAANHQSAEPGSIRKVTQYEITFHEKASRPTRGLQGV